MVKGLQAAGRTEGTGRAGLGLTALVPRAERRRSTIPVNSNTVTSYPTNPHSNPCADAAMPGRGGLLAHMIAKPLQKVESRAVLKEGIVTCKSNKEASYSSNCYLRKGLSPAIKPGSYPPFANLHLPQLAYLFTGPPPTHTSLSLVDSSITIAIIPTLPSKEPYLTKAA